MLADVLEARVGVRKQAADVALARRPEQGVDDGVDEDVAVGVPEQARGVRDLDAAQNERPPLDEPMEVVAQTDSSVQG